MSIIEIRSIWDVILWAGEASSTKDAMEQAVRSGARLDGARLDPIRDDIYKILESAPNEVPGLLAAMREGRFDGTHYKGECACLVGTIANLRHESHDALTVPLWPDASRLAEVWALAIRKGHTSATNPVAAITVGWIEAWITARGASVPPHLAIYWRGDVGQLARDIDAAGVSHNALAEALHAITVRT